MHGMSMVLVGICMMLSVRCMCSSMATFGGDTILSARPNYGQGLSMLALVHVFDRMTLR